MADDYLDEQDAAVASAVTGSSSDYSFLDDDDDCSFCGGDGYDECDDPIQCCAQHTAGGLCPCKACGGTGRAKDQVIW